MIGIDLGTTNSLVAVFENGASRILSNEMGEQLTPSAVALSKDKQVLIGRAAKDRLVVEPNAGVTQFKRDMGSKKTYRFGGRKWTPTECSALILREMKRIAEMQLSRPVENVVITVPAYFHDQQRNATLDAAQIAGLKVDRILNEPTAAALAFGYQNPETEKQILVFDLGGGTFDVTLLEIFDGVIEVKASGGVSHLGGEDYTDAFVKWICEKQEWKPEGGDRIRWRQHIEMVKRRLAKQERATASLGSKEVEVSRADLMEATLALNNKIFPVIKRCLRDANITHEDLDDILMVGGATRTVSIIDELARQTDHIPNQKLDPDKAIAMGAAIQSALCEKDGAVQDIVLTDVCPHTLGIEIARDMGGGRQESGFFHPIIDRNTIVPISRSDVFNTLHPDQDQINLKVFQGESRMVSGNQMIGAIRITGMRHMPGQDRPGEAEVRFSYDSNGILEVEVTKLHNREVIRKVIQQQPGKLSQKEIEETIKRLAPLKIHPRDKLENRALIERAQRMFMELSGVQRRELTIRLDAFEDALETQNPEFFKPAAHQLDLFLKPFFTEDGEYDGSLES